MTRWLILLLVIVAPYLGPVSLAVHGAVKETDSRVALGNRYMELRFHRQGEQIAVTTLVNRLTGREIPLTIDDFALGIEGQRVLHAADFALEELAEVAIPGGRRVTERLIQHGGIAKLSVVYELLDRDPFLRRHLEFFPAASVPLRQVEVWRAGVRGTCSAQEDGPPIYSDRQCLERRRHEGLRAAGISRRHLLGPGVSDRL